MQLPDKTPWVLSIQSHVAFGHVGNAAATFPLQRMGIEVMPIHTVQFSNHTGYGEVKGQVFTAAHIHDVLEGMKARGALKRCQAVLSGYLGDASIGRAVQDAVAAVRSVNPNACYLCDPVMGDVGRGVFVRDGIPEYIRDNMLSQASIITPNRFEFELLSQHTLGSIDEAVTQAQRMIKRSPTLDVVVITSLDTADVPSDQLYTLAITAHEAWYVAAPRLSMSPLPNGMGDVFSAVLLGHILQGDSLPNALSVTVSTLSGLLSVMLPGQRDLPLIEAQSMIVAPEPHYEARRWV